jgi:MFS family permease
MMALALALTLAGTLPAWMVGAMSVQIRAELDFSLVALGLAIAIFRLAGATMAPLVGQLPDRIGALAAMRIAAGLAGISSIGIALFATSYVRLVAFLALAGLSNALGQTASTLALVRAVKQARQGLAFGMKQAALPIGAMVAGVSVPLIALTVGWRWGFVIGALFSFAIPFALPRTGFASRPPADGAPDARRGPLALLALAAAMFLSAASAGALTTFLVESSVVAGFTPGQAGILLAGGSVLAILMRLYSGVAADRRDGGHLRVCAVMIATGSLGFVLLGNGTIGSILLGTVLAFAFGWGFPGLFWYAIVRQNQTRPAQATAILMPGPMFGGVVGPIAFGWLVERFGYGVSWRYVAGWMLASAGLMLWGRALSLRARSMAS